MMRTSALRTERAPARRWAAQDAPPSPPQIESARRRFVAAKTAIAFCLTGDVERSAESGGEYGMLKSVQRLQHHFAVYFACTHMAAPIRHLAAALNVNRRELQRSLAFCEAMRGAPLFEQALAHAEATCPRDP